MVDHDGDVALSFAEGELVDPDPPQPLERVALPDALVGGNSFDDPPDRRPADPHQLTDRALGGVRRQPGRLLLERPSEATAVTRPGSARDHDAMAAALDPRRLPLDERLCRAEVERSPAARPLAAVIAPSPPPADTTARAITPPRTHPDNNRVVLDDDLLNHRPPRTHQPCQ